MGDSPSSPAASENVIQPVTSAGMLAPAPAPMIPVSAVVQAQEGASASGLDAAKIVQAVTRTLAWRDLEALDAGREVVLRLDEALMPETVLTFRASKVTNPAEAAGVAPQTEVLVSLETRSREVREFLDSHGQSLIDAMSREAPSVRWVRGAVNSWLDKPGALSADLSSALSAAAPVDTAQPLVASAAAATPHGGASRDRDAQGASQPDSRDSDGSGGSSSQERGSSSGSSPDQGQGQTEGRSPAAISALDEGARAEAAQRWSTLSETARQRASQDFAEAVDGRA